MTAERDTVSVGSCLACGGPAQFISQPDGSVDLRHVELPNIDEDLGGGWSLMEINRLSGGLHVGDRRWRAIAEVLEPSQDVKRGDIEYGHGDSPSAAYLALRTAIEKRR